MVQMKRLVQWLKAFAATFPDFEIILMLLSGHAGESKNYARTLSLLNTDVS